MQVINPKLLYDLRVIVAVVVIPSSILGHALLNNLSSACPNIELGITLNLLNRVHFGHHDLHKHDMTK